MNRSPSLYVASLAALALITFTPASRASTISSVAQSRAVGSATFEAVGALASRALDPALHSTDVAGSGITDATAPVPGRVPEPETMALFGLGLGVMVISKRRTACKKR